MIKGTTPLGPLEASAVREVANIGLGHATTALAQMTGKAIGMSVPDAESIALEELPYLMGDETIRVGVSLPLTGDLEGHVAFVLSWPAAQSLWTLLLGHAPKSLEEIDVLQASTMTEVGNILNGGFLTAIADLTGLHLEAMPPQFSADLGIAVVGAIVCEAAEADASALAIRTTIAAAGEDLEGTFLFMPAQVGLRRMLAALGLGEGD